MQSVRDAGKPDKVTITVGLPKSIFTAIGVREVELKPMIRE
jgi:hypothetical protein